MARSVLPMAFTVWFLSGCPAIDRVTVPARSTGTFGHCSTKLVHGLHRVDSGLTSLCVQFDAFRKASGVTLLISSEGPCELSHLSVELDEVVQPVTQSPAGVSLSPSEYDRARVVGVRATDRCGHLVGRAVSEHSTP
jgi:hypothetical protein